MLTLDDGRKELWQWDTGRKISVDEECSQVHFSNKVFGRSVDVNVVDGLAPIPDFLLQTDNDLIVWAFFGTPENGYTKVSKTFKINRRNKPAGYVFTPTDQLTLAELEERLSAIEESQDPDAIINVVEDYLEKNPFEAPVQSVNEKTGEVNLTAEDVGAISQDDLQEATNEALAQAKESGEFDGQPGKDGLDGKDGSPGKDGADGVSATHSWNGTVLTITSASGTSSADLKGEKGDKGDTGAQGVQGIQGEKGADGVSATHSWNGTTLNITSASGTSSADLKGEKGDTGADGYTPVKGTDYWTAADKSAMVSDVLAALPTWNGGSY